MRRKLVKQGPSTLTVSLPLPWVRVNNLHPGDEVLLDIKQNNIIITPEMSGDTGSTITVNVQQLSDGFVGLLLSALHKKGFDEIRLLIERHQVRIIENRVNRHLLGYEIVQQDAGSVVIRFVTKIDSEELPVLMRRAFLVTLSLAEAVVNNPAAAEEALVLEETNNRLTNYCERILNKNAHQEKDVIFRYLIVWLLEKIADEYRDIIIRGKAKSADAATCLHLLKQFYELFYKYSIEKHDVFVQQLKNEINTFSKKESAYVGVLVLLQQANGSVIGIHMQ
jgi:phosphate uptake regulator